MSTLLCTSQFKGLWSMRPCWTWCSTRSEPGTSQWGALGCGQEENMTRPLLLHGIILRWNIVASGKKYFFICYLTRKPKIPVEIYTKKKCFPPMTWSSFLRPALPTTLMQQWPLLPWHLGTARITKAKYSTAPQSSPPSYRTAESLHLPQKHHMLLPHSPPVITKVPSPAAQRKQRVTISLFEGFATRWRPAAVGLLGHVPLGMHFLCFCTEKQQPAKHSRTVQLAGTSQWTCPEHKEGSAALLLLWWRDQTLLIFINYPAWSWFCLAINHSQPQIFQWIIPPMTFFLPIPFTEVDKKKKKRETTFKKLYWDLTKIFPNNLLVHVPLVTSWQSLFGMYLLLDSMQLLHFYSYSNAFLHPRARLE